jgi:hypothetical protein
MLEETACLLAFLMRGSPMAVGKYSFASALSAILLLTPGAKAADQEKIQQAITRGLEHLKSQQDKGTGTWPFYETFVGPAKTGATALAGVTLLECGVPSGDPVVQKAADAVRRAAVHLTQTYELSTAILFLDRLGDPGDVALIQSMGVRLLGGQNASGGWSYECPSPSRQEVVRLTAQLGKPEEREKPSSSSPSVSRNRPALPPEIQGQLRAINPGTRQLWSDNSNTKFATLALWVARRHGIPVEKALRMVEARFRNSQNPDGGWGYLPGTANARPGFRGAGLRGSLGSMTCAGLLGLATGQGVANEATLRTDPSARDVRSAARRSKRDTGQDSAVRAGLSLLGQLIGNDARPMVPLYMREQGDEYYFLWALERVAVAYGLSTIGHTDWYAWGSDMLVAKQGQDGGWHGKYEGGVDDCFALLFLARANLTRDLTVSLRGQLTDPQGRDLGGKEPPAMPAPKPDMRPKATPAQASRPGRTGDSEPTPSTSAPGRSPPRDTSAGETDLERETSRLSAALVDSDRARQNELLDQYESSKGVVYTQALAAAIPKLSGPVQAKARDVLAERLSRMTAGTLRARMKDEDAEIRRAAALACATKEDRAQVPELISLLDDSQPGVVRAAHAALKSLTGKDLGPPAGAGRTERSAAAARWKSWWGEQKGKE